MRQTEFLKRLIPLGYLFAGFAGSLNVIGQIFAKKWI